MPKHFKLLQWFFCLVWLTVSIGKAQETTPLSQFFSSPFRETWCYWMVGEERFLRKGFPFSDVGVFSVQLNEDGDLIIPKVEKEMLQQRLGASVRFHLVIAAPWNHFFLHLLLRRDLPLYRRLIENILPLFQKWDGIQIDFESLRPSTREAFLLFLQDLYQQRPQGKILSVAVLPRWSEEMMNTPTGNDPFDYAKIGEFADRVVVMAYDQHHRNSEPGPIASLGWCRQIAEFSLSKIPREKLIMGIPLYGRSWQVPNLSQAYRFSDVQTLLQQRPELVEQRDALMGSLVHYIQETEVFLYFETFLSIQAKLSLYQQLGIQSVAFWRLGQEENNLWEKLSRFFLFSY